MTSQEFEKRELPSICRHARIICNSVQSVEMTYTLFVDISRVHIRHHGKTLLWPKWTDSAERAAVWTSGYLSSTYLNDELLAAKTCKRTVICTGSVVCTLMDTLPSRDQIPKHCWRGKKTFGRNKKRPRCVRGMNSKEEMDFHLGRDCLELSALATKMGCRGTCIFMSWEFHKRKKKACVCAFSCEAGHCTEGLYHVCVVKPLWREVGRNQKTELLSGPRPRALSAETKHLLKHWTFCNFTYLI